MKIVTVGREEVDQTDVDSPIRLVDQITGSQQEAGWNGNAESPCGLQVDSQFELRRLLNRQVCRVCTAEKLARINSQLAPKRGEVRSIAHEAPAARILLQLINGRNSLTESELGNSCSSNEKECVSTDDERASFFFAHRFEGCFKCAVIVGFQNQQFDPPISPPPVEPICALASAPLPEFTGELLYWLDPPIPKADRSASGAIRLR